MPITVCIVAEGIKQGQANDRDGWVSLSGANSRILDRSLAKVRQEASALPAHSGPVCVDGTPRQSIAVQDKLRKTGTSVGDLRRFMGLWLRGANWKTRISKQHHAG